MTSNQNYYHSENYLRQYNTDDFYTKISNAVSKQMGRQLFSTEVEETKSFIRKLDPSLLGPIYKEKTIKIAVSTLVDEFKKFNCNTEQDNIQQTLRNTIGTTSESSTVYSIYDKIDQNNLSTPKAPVAVALPTSIDISKIFGKSNYRDTAIALNPDSLYRKNFIILDSRYRILNNSVSSPITSFSWAYVLQSISNSQGTVSSIGNVRDVMALRIYPCRIPYVKSADNKYSRVSILINEIASQSFIAHENTNFHFMLKSVVDDTFINLDTQDYNDGYYYFEKPITYMPSITLSFGSPIEKISFDNDRDLCTIDCFSIQPLTKITTGWPTANPHNLKNGDTVYFSNFKVASVDPILVEENAINEALTNSVNRIEGWIISVIDSTSFSIELDMTTIQSPTADVVFDVYYGSKRMFIPLEITFIMADYDNNL
jgi:hypothetical protein